MQSLWKGFERRPADPVLFAKLRDNLEAEGDFDGLIRLYEERAAAVGDEEALYLRLAIAEVWAARGPGEARAAAAYREALKTSSKLGPEQSEQLRQALTEVFKSRGDWQGLAILVGLIADQRAPGKMRAAILRELAALRRDRLSDPEGAARALRAAAEEPGGPVAECERDLHELVGAHPDNAAIFEALYGLLHARLQDPSGIRALLALLDERLARLADDSAQRAKILLEMGGLVAKHSDDIELGLRYLSEAQREGADSAVVIEGLERLRTREPGHLGVLHLLRMLYLSLERWGEMVERGLAEVELTTDRHDRGSIEFQLAGVVQDKLEDPDTAGDLFVMAHRHNSTLAVEVAERATEILAARPDHAAVRECLKTIYREQGDNDRLLELLEGQEARSTSKHERTALLVEMAQLSAQRCGRPDKALDYYEAASDLAGDDLDDIVDGLFDLFEQGYYVERVGRVLRGVCRRTDRWDELVRLLHLQLDTAASREEQGALHFELGHLAEAEMDDAQLAMEHYQRAFKLDPDQPSYIEAGRNVYRKMGNLDMVARLYDVQLKVAGGPAQAARLLLDKSKVLGDELGDYPRALEALGRACALSPGNVAINAALIKLVLAPEGVDTLKDLGEAYVEAGRPAEAAAIYLLVSDSLREAAATFAVDDPRYDEHIALADTCDLNAFKLDPTGNARTRAGTRLESGLVEAGRWADLIDVLQRKANVAPLGGERIAILRELAGIAWQELRDGGRAAEAFREILELDLSQETVFQEVDAIYEAIGDRTSRESLLIWVLDMAPWAAASASIDRRTSLLTALARLQVQLGKETEARQTFLKVSELRPNDQTVVAFFGERADSAEGAVELFRVLERGVVEIFSARDRARRRMEMATIAEERLSDALLAADQYVAILDLQDVEPEVTRRARRQLNAIYRREGEIDAVVELLEREFAEPDVLAERQEAILNELITLHEEDRNDPDAAQDVLLRLADHRPDQPEPRLRLADAFNRRGQLYEEAEVLRALIADGRNEGWRRISTGEGQGLRLEDLIFRLGRLEVRLGELEPARDSLRTLLDNEAYRQSAINELQQVLIRLEDIAGLMELLDGQVKHARDTSDKVHFLGRMATLAEQELRDRAQAIELWKRALEFRPNDDDALEALESLYERDKNWDEVVSTCRVRLKVTTETTARAHLFRKMGRIERDRGNLGAARDVFRQLLKEAPDDLLARQELYEIHKTQNDHGALVSIIEDMLRYAAEPDHRHGLLIELADIGLDHLDRHELAVSALERVAAEFPTDAASLARLYDLHVDRGHWPKAAVVLANRAELAPDGATKIALLSALGELHRDKNRDPTAAAEVFASILEIHDAHRPTLSSLEALYLALGDHERLVTVRDKLLALVEPEEQSRLLRSLAKGLEVELDRPEDAFVYIEQLHLLEPEEPGHLAELRRLADKTDMWARVFDLLSDDAARAPSLQERLGIQKQMAEVAETKLGRAADALEIYKEIFLGQPATGEILDEIQRLAAQQPEAWPEVIGLFDRLVTTATDPADKVQAYWRVAEILHVELHQPREAFGTLQHALSFDTHADETLERLRALAEAATLWHSLAKLGEARWHKATRAEDKVAILLETSEIVHDKLADPERALEHLVLAFQIAPRDETVNARLVDLVAEQGVWELLGKLYDVVVSEHERRGDVEGQVHFLGLIAAAYERAGRPHDAFAASLRAFELRPMDLEARARLERLGVATDQVPDVIGAYRGHADRARRDVGTSLLMAAAGLLLDGLGRRDDAAETLRRVLQADPDNREARERLEGLYRQDDDIESLIALYAHRADRTTERSARFEAYLEVAELICQTDDPERAVEHYRRALRLDPHNIELLESLAALYERLGQPDRRARCFEQILDIKRDDVDVKSVEVTEELANLYVQTERITKAVEALTRLLALRPLRTEVMERMVGLLIDAGRFDELLTVIDARIDALDALVDLLSHGELDEADRERLTPDDGTKVRRSTLRAEVRSLFRRAIDVAERQRHDRARAATILERFVERYPSDADGLEHLADLYGEMGRWSSHIEVLERRLEGVEDSQTRALVLRRLAEAFEDHLEAPERAADCLNSLVAEFPDDRTVHADLGRLYARDARWREALASYERAASDEGSALPAGVRSEILVKMARICEDELDEPESAFALYERALEADADSAPARRGVIRHLGGTDQWQRHAELLRIEVGLEDDAFERCRLLLEIGALHRDRGEDMPGALAAFSDAASEDETSLVALRDLGDAAVHTEAWQVAYEAYASLLDGRFTRIAMEGEPLRPDRLRPYESPDDPAFVLSTVRLGNAAEALGHFEEAVERYNHALRVRSGNLIALLHLGRHLVAAGDNDSVAHRLLTKLHKGHAETLTDADLAETHYLMAVLARRKGRDDRALRHASEASRLTGHRPASTMAYELAINAGEHAEAAQFLRTVAASEADVDERARMLVAVAHLYAEELGEPDQARELYEEALELVPESEEAAGHLVELHIQAGAWDTAASVAQRLVETDVRDLEQDPSVGADPIFVARRVRHLLARGDVHRGRGHHHEALEDYEQALDLDGRTSGALDRIGEVLSAQGDFDALHTRYKDYVATLSDDEVAVKAEVLGALGRLLGERHRRPDLAQAVFEEVALLRPDEIASWDALIDVYLAAEPPNLAGALSALRRVVTMTGVDERRLRQVVTLYRTHGHEGAALQVLRLLDFCRCATADEQQRLRERHDELSELGPGCLAGAVHDHYILPELVRGPLGELMELLVTAAPASVYQSLTTHDVDEGDLISDRRNLNVASIFRESRAALGLEEIELYLKRDRPPGVGVVLARPPALIIGDDVFRGLFNKEQRFVLGMALEACRPRFLPAASNTLDDFRALLEAIYERAEQQRLTTTPDERERRDIWHERLDESLDADTDQRLRALVEQIDRVARPTAESYLADMKRASVRVGLFMARDPLVALKRLLREAKGVRSPSVQSCGDLAEAMAASPSVREVVLYMLSHDFLAARAGIRGDEIDVAAISHTPLADLTPPSVSPVPKAEAIEPPPTERSALLEHEQGSPPALGTSETEADPSPIAEDTEADPSLTGRPAGAFESADDYEAIEVADVVEELDGRTRGAMPPPPPPGMAPASPQLIEVVDIVEAFDSGPRSAMPPPPPPGAALAAAELVSADDIVESIDSTSAAAARDHDEEGDVFELMDSFGPAVPRSEATAALAEEEAELVAADDIVESIDSDFNRVAVSPSGETGPTSRDGEL